MPFRRDYLAGLATTAIGGLAGCTVLGGSKPLNRVEMDNNTGEDMVALVKVTNEDSEILFERTFNIKAGNQDEGAEWFEGEPARISVAIGDREPLTAA